MRGRADVAPPKRLRFGILSPAKGAVIELGVVRESHEGERRVAVAPSSVPALIELGFDVCIERYAGAPCGYDDAAYREEGARIVESGEAWAAPLVLKVRPPSVDEVESLSKGACLVSLIHPARNEAVVEALAGRGVDVIALDRVPRISRAQSMDVLSSMANLAGYRAVLEAATLYQGTFAPQVTAAGTLPPVRVLVIGAGVAGLAAIAAARGLGAEVRVFDVRPATKEQVESLGGRFLEVELEESGDGEGGYAKTMSKEFIEAEMALFRAQAAEVRVIITTALVPGKKAPVLVPKDVVEALAPGSVVVDLAAEQGGNCELTEAGRVVEHGGVQVVGFTDLVSRMGHSASRFFGANVTRLLAEMGGAEDWALDLDNEIVRGACVVREGEVLPPPPRREPEPKKPAPAADERERPSAAEEPKASAAKKPPSRAWGPTLASLVAVGLLFVLGRIAPSEFLQHFTVFVLACFVGWQVVWSVSPALHTPLMSVTNAISGIIIVGGMLQVSGGPLDLATILGAVAILLAAINISGGFLVTQRMLAMFRRDE